MTNVLVTGGKGFLGRNLITRLQEIGECEVQIFDVDNDEVGLLRGLDNADVVFHLAGVNRPTAPQDFESGNVELTKRLCDHLRRTSRLPKVVFASSIQAILDNPYGVSKRKAEELLRELSLVTGVPVQIFRLKNLFGPWCRPNYNSVTATFCHNVARGQPIAISDPHREIELSYVDDVVTAFLRQMGTDSAIQENEIPARKVSLGELAGCIQAFHDMRLSLSIPDFSEPFMRALYATYLSYVPVEELESRVQDRSDERGSLAEFIKSERIGQVFVSRTRPGVTRGNHYHHTKAERFLVVEGEASIRMRSVNEAEIIEYRVCGNEFKAVDIPPWFTHCITNIGSSEMVTLFWADEIFNPNLPDTYYLPVETTPFSSARDRTDTPILMTASDIRSSETL